MFRLIVDENIAFADTAFNQFGKVTLIPGRLITNESLKNVDALLVRSVTNVNEKLLKNTPVKFVGTTTIGTDHIDLNYLNNNKITFTDAKGCNAFSVAEYVVAALLNFSVKYNFSLKGKSIGIVGVGNVGSKVAAFAETLGMNVLLNDPPLQRDGKFNLFVGLDEILKCDIITLHTPLNMEGVDKTYHLFNKSNLDKLNEGTILINSSRGAVVNNLDLLTAIDKKNLKVVLDVWENEPAINIELLEKVLISTPHIAGYSYEGRVNGTKIIYESLCEFLGEEKTFAFSSAVPQNSIKCFNKMETLEVELDKLVSSIYSIKDDDQRMRKMQIMNQTEINLEFDLQRKNYPIRREFCNYSVQLNQKIEIIQEILTKLRFNVS